MSLKDLIAFLNKIYSKSLSNTKLLGDLVMAIEDLQFAVNNGVHNVEEFYDLIHKVEENFSNMRTSFRDGMTDDIIEEFARELLPVLAQLKDGAGNYLTSVMSREADLIDEIPPEEWPEEVKKQKYQERVEDAARCYVRRKNRTEHPSGKFDRAGRWYPDDDERQACCDNISSPSRAFPYSYMTHCRTIPHVARKFNVAESDLRKAARGLMQ